MPFIVEAKGNEVYPTGGPTPQDLYGEDTWGPAIMGGLNRTGLTGEQASTFESEETARLALVLLTAIQPSILSYRVREV